MTLMGLLMVSVLHFGFFLQDAAAQFPSGLTLSVFMDNGAHACCGNQPTCQELTSCHLTNFTFNNCFNLPSSFTGVIRSINWTASGFPPNQQYKVLKWYHPNCAGGSGGDVSPDFYSGDISQCTDEQGALGVCGRDQIGYFTIKSGFGKQRQAEELKKKIKVL